MKNWHRKLHFFIWIVLLASLAVAFVLARTLVLNQQQQANLSQQSELFEQWEEDFNPKKEAEEQVQ